MLLVQTYLKQPAGASFYFLLRKCKSRKKRSKTVLIHTYENNGLIDTTPSYRIYSPHNIRVTTAIVCVTLFVVRSMWNTDGFNRQRDDDGITYARNAMILCGLALNTNRL